jgi:hypothetical protein
MKISEYLELQKTDDDVYKDINNYMRGFDMDKYGDMESLLLDVQKVITSYRSLAAIVVDKIDIEKCI